MQRAQKRIVVLGAGVAGVRFILDFEPKIRNFENAVITLIDQYNYHQYIHKLHEVAGGRTEPNEVGVPIEWIFRKKRVEFVQAKVESINTEKKEVMTDKGTIHYSVLIIALGSQTCYYEVKGLEENSLGLKSIKEAYQIRKRVEEVFASAKNGTKPLTFIIGGGGFSGVELAGELSELLPTMTEKYGVDIKGVRLIIVEAMDRILPGWDLKMAEEAKEILLSKGVGLMLHQRVVEVDDKKITLENGDKMDFDLLIWTGGVEGVSACPKLDYSEERRVLVSSICEAINNPDVYAIGDCSYICNVSAMSSLMTNAHTAMEQASLLAQNLHYQLVGKPLMDYVPKHVGEIITIGSDHAVGLLWNIRLRGWIAQIAKKIIHLAYIYSIGGIKLLLKGKHLGKQFMKESIINPQESNKRMHIKESLLAKA